MAININGEFHTDSQKIDFPINVDGYDENSYEKLSHDLEATFPGLSIKRE